VQAGAGSRRVAAEGADDAILARLHLVDARRQPQSQHYTHDPYEESLSAPREPPEQIIQRLKNIS